MNPIKPTMREKKRYICFRSGNFSKEEVSSAILSRVKLWIGEKNFALARVKLELYEVDKGIISCNHKKYLDVRMGIMLTEKINNKRAKIEVFAVSGMIKKAKEKIKNGTA